MSELTVPPDQDHRTRAWQTFDRTLDVSAGAGTGKTRVLVDRYLAWVLGQAWSTLDDARPSSVVGSILAITFTEKAAGEMQERIARSLRVMCGQPAGLSEVETAYVQGLAVEMAEYFGVSSDAMAERAALMLAQAHRMEVSTIHSFCARVLRTWPLEAGLHPELDVDVDGRRRKKAVRRAFVEATQEGLRTEDGPRWARLLDELKETTLQQLMVAALDSGFEDKLAPAPHCESLAAFCAELFDEANGIRDQVARGSQNKHNRVCDGLATAAEVLRRPGFAEDPRGSMSDDEHAAVAELAKELDGYPSSKKVLGLLGEAFRDAASLCARQLAEVSVVNQRVFADFLDLYGDALAGLRREMERAGTLSFDDLLRHTDRLLADRPSVARQLADRYGQILVDEFQDTDPVQCRILSAMADADPERARLFVVGDPKQSIYAFRNADLAAYEAFAARLGERLVLRASFRSQEQLVRALNAAFDRLFVARAGMQPGPQALAPTRAGRDDLPAVQVWDAGAADGEKRNAEQAREAEANAICRAVRALDAQLPDESGRRWSRFAVLSRVQSEAAGIVAVLEAAGVPCVVSGDKEFYRRQEVLDASNLLRVLLDEADAVAWVGLLRCPIGGGPDRVMVDLARAGFFARGDHIGAVRDAELGAPPDRARHLRRLATLVKTLSDLREALLTGPVDLWLEQVVERLPVPDVYASEYLGERKSANFLTVLSGFCDAAMEGSMPLQEWIDNVAGNLVGAQDESESALADETTDAVRIMSIHGSKGLQFDHVFVPRLDWQRSGGLSDEVSLTRGPSGWVVQAKVKGKAATTWGIGAIRERYKKVDEAETLRLLYVAATRARETLTLLGKRGSAPMARLVEAGFVEAPRAFCDEVHLDAHVQPPAEGPLPREEELAAAGLAFWRGAGAERNRAAAEPWVVSASTRPALDEDEVEVSVVSEDDGESARQLGIEVHALLEAWDDADMAGVSAEAAALYTGFMRSPLAERVRAARSVHRELPFVGPGSVGVIDLLLETDQGWVVVDYKTNAVADEAAAQQAALAYRAQGRAYLNAVKSALGTDDVTFEAWFVRGPWAVPVTLRA